MSTFLPYSTLRSLVQLEQFCLEHFPFFSEVGRHFEVYASEEGYELVAQDTLACETFKYVGKQKATNEFLERCVHLLQESGVLHAVKHAQSYGGVSSLPHYLFWLACKNSKDSESSSLSDASHKPNRQSYSKKSLVQNSSVSNRCEDSITLPALQEKQMLLYSTHQPSCTSLLHTLFLATDHRVEVLPMQARLLLEVPNGYVNREQLDYVINTYVNPVWHYFECLTSDFKNEGAAESNYKYMHKHDCQAELQLVFQDVSSSQRYKISLKNMYFDEELYSKDIHQAMTFLEKSADPLMIGDGYVFLPKWDSGDLVDCKPSPNKLHFGAVMLSLNKNAHLAEHGMFFLYKQLGSDRLCLSLKPIVNPLISKKASVIDIQWKKMRLSQESTTAYIPPIEQLFAGMQIDDYILGYFYKRPDRLYLCGQYHFVNWLLERPVKDVNVAMLSLLRRVQEKESFTLPGSAELVTTISFFAKYLLGNACVDESVIKPYLRDQRSLPILKRTKQSFCKFIKLDPASFHGELLEVYNRLHALYDDLSVLKKVCLLLSNKDACIEATRILEEHFKVQLSDGLHNVPFPPVPTAFLIVRFLFALTEVYGFNISNDLKYCEALICKGILPLFLLQSEIDVPLLNKVACLPIEIASVSFDLHNEHDGKDFEPIIFLLHDFLFHAFSIDSIIDAYWKLLQNEDRVLLMHNIEAVRNKLSKNEAADFTFINESITCKKLLKAFDLLYFVLVHEKNSRGRTHTRTCILPSAFPHAFLEKSSNYFESLDKEQPAALKLRKFYGDFTEDMRALLPLEGNSSFPWFAAYILFDTIVDQTRNAKALNAEVSDDDLLMAFKVGLAKQEQLLCLYANNWDALINNGVLYPSCAEIKLPLARLNALATPYFQDRVRKHPMNFPLIKEMASDLKPFYPVKDITAPTDKKSRCVIC